MKHKVYERALATCAVMLLLSILLKVFGIQWLELNTDIAILHELDNLVMNDVLFSFMYSLAFKTFNGYLICISVTKDSKFDFNIIFISALSVLFAYMLRNSALVFIYDFLVLFYVCRKKATFREYIYVMVLNAVYQLISLFIRGLGVQLSYYPVAEEILLNLDYYILLIITYLYLKKEDTSLCSIVQASYSFLASKLCRKPLNESSRNK